MATINDRLLKEVEAGADEITCLKAVQRATADQCRQEKETADQREEQASQLGNALKAAENARAAEQEAWAAQEADWGMERDNLLEAYKKCRQGLERAVHKLQEEKEKQTAKEEGRRSIPMKRRMRGRCPPASESGEEQTRGPTPATGRRVGPEAVGRPVGHGGPPAGLEPPGKGDGPRRGDRGAGLPWREEQWRSPESRRGTGRSGMPYWPKPKRPSNSRRSCKVVGERRGLISGGVRQWPP